MATELVKEPPHGATPAKKLDRAGSMMERSSLQDRPSGRKGEVELTSPRKRKGAKVRDAYEEEPPQGQSSWNWLPALCCVP